MKKSVNALTQDVYDIPEVLDDSKNIEKFLIKNNGKKKLD